MSTPPMTIVRIKKTPVRKPAAKPKVATKKTQAKKQLSRNGYLCFYKTVDKRGGGKTKLYFWAKKPKSGEGWRKVFEVPEGKVVRVTSTGLPVLANKGSKPTAKPKTKAKPVAKKARAKTASKSLRPQCSAVTPDGKQCKNSARQGSKYCGSHKGYRPKKADGKAKDTKPRVAKAKDTAPKGLKVPAKKAAPKQVTRNGYLLYRNGPRFFFSKSKSAKKGWKRINSIPAGFKVKVTDNGLPVLARK